MDGRIGEGGKRSKMPKGILPALAIICVSLMLCVCATVMVSRASADISELEDRISELRYEIGDLEGKLEVKNNMLEIKRIAVEEYGMISSEYASGRYLDVKEEEVIKKYDSSGKGSSWLDGLLRAIGLRDGG